MSDHLQRYLSALFAIHCSGAGVEETSYYGPLLNLLNEAGGELKPRVTCILNPSNRGAGIPDGGFFTPDQFQRGSDAPVIKGQAPSRGAMEVKGAHDDLDTVVRSEQVARYCRQYRQLLVTNLREFRLVALDADGNPRPLEGYRLADSEIAFWAAAGHPHQTSVAHGERFEQFLKRVMLHAAPIVSPQEVAWFLASYARDARVRIEGVDLPALNALRMALEESLGIKFQGERGDHFFRSTLVQTLFYGLFSAWVIWSRQRLPLSRSGFDWKMAQWSLQVPVIRALFEQVASPARLKPLGLVEPLNWAGEMLNRVDIEAFSSRFEEEQAVQYFYEPFLEAFDPELRKELGVWYTPPEIVRYMVARVDRALREELGIEDGLADPRVDVLDPCCGTGAYLVEVLKRIETTLRERRGDGLLADDLKQAAMERVFGFEILPAPFVVAHLQLGLLLRRLGAPLSDAMGERAAVYLTNALTGWEPPDPVKEKLVQGRLAGMPEMGDERDAARRVKRDARILVIIGNPPYNGFAGMAVEEERELSTAYRAAKRAPAPHGQGLNDLYVRFFRMAERRIVEQSGRGVVCLISNYSWLDGLSFTGMRERYLEAFDSIWIDNLHGDRIISEYAPGGETSETVFAIQGSSPGIKVGTTIALLAARGLPKKLPGCRLLYKDFNQPRAADRRKALLSSLRDTATGEGYTGLEPIIELGLPFKPRAVGKSYLKWPLLPDLFPVSFPGVKTSRDDVVVDIDRDRLVERLQRYFDPPTSDEEIRALMPGAMESTKRFDARATRSYLVKRGFLPDRVVRYCYRPFDVRWLYWEPETKLLDEKRSEYVLHVMSTNVWLSAGQRNRKADFYQPQFTTLLADHHIVESNVGMFPLYLKSGVRQPTLFDEGAADTLSISPNLSEASQGYIRSLGADEADLFHHSLASLHAPDYRTENAGALRQDWPRIPLPAGRDALLASATLGRRLAALLDPDQAVSGVTAGTIRPELRAMGQTCRADGRSLNASEDLTITVGWGHAGQGGVTMPGQGKLKPRA